MQPCLFCTGDASEPDHRAHCDGRQGVVEAQVGSGLSRTSVPGVEPPAGRYSEALAVYRDTSRDAWQSVLPYLPPIDARIVGYIGGRSGGATSEECELSLGLKHQTVSAQIRHLFEAGLLTTTGDKRPTQSGRQAYIWNLPPRRHGDG